MKNVALLIATTGGAGYVPLAPGTAGAVVGVAWHYASRTWSPAWQGAALVILIAVGVWAAGITARHAGREDPGHVVVDEVAGQALTLLLLQGSAAAVFVGFLLFRFFDIMKPWPVRSLESLPGGLGIMADDVMAGVYGWLVLKAIVTWQPALL